MKYLLLLFILVIINSAFALESNESIDNITTCDFRVDILTNKTIFFDDFEFKIQVNRTNGSRSEVLISKHVTDPFGNIIKTYKNSTFEIVNHRTQKFSPILKKNNAYIIKAEIFPSCYDNYTENNIAYKEIFMIGNKQNESSYIKIENILDLGTDKIAKFGSIIKVRIAAYKGNTNKKTIKAWIELENVKVTKQSSINIEEKYTKQTITIPLQIFPNCKGKLDNDTYYVKIKGLDSDDEMPVNIISILKDNCEIVEKVINKTFFVNITEKVYINITKNTETNLNKTVINESMIVYESKQEKSKRSALYFFCGLLILLIIKIKTENE